MLHLYVLSPFATSCHRIAPLIGYFISFRVDQEDLEVLFVHINLPVWLRLPHRRKCNLLFPFQIWLPGIIAAFDETILFMVKIVF